MLSDDSKKKDQLHDWVGMGKFFQYEDEYINNKPVVSKTGMQPLVERLMNEFVSKARLFDLDLRVTSSYRSIEEQNKLYAQGRTTPGNIVTNAKGGESLHNYGVAFDIVDRKKGYNLTDREWAWLNFIWKYLTLDQTGTRGTWGGDWTSFVDKPHFELTLGYSLSDFQKGKVDYTKYQ